VLHPDISKLRDEVGDRSAACYLYVAALTRGSEIRLTIQWGKLRQQSLLRGVHSVTAAFHKALARIHPM
jgi:hypothetical protein